MTRRPHFDPAHTLSGTMPTLPPAHISVLDPRFPIRLAEPARLFWELVGEWEDRETVVSQTIRATQQHTDAEERFVQPLPEPEPAALPVISYAPPPAPYPALEPAALDEDWNTGEHTAVLVDAGGRRHGRDGKFLPAALGDD